MCVSAQLLHMMGSTSAPRSPESPVSPADQSPCASTPLRSPAPLGWVQASASLAFSVNREQAVLSC